MTRIVAGVAGGRRLVVPDGPTRPTSDRAREGLFSTVTSLWGPLDGARVLDLYAGSGAVGLEAASRGAERVLLVESSPSAVRAIRDNIAALGLPGTQVLATTVEKAVAGEPPDAFDVVFLDPPYALAGGAVVAVLEALLAGGWLGRDALVAVERSTRGGGFEWPEGLAPLRERRYGEGTIWYARG
ncbi:16S rRNA (guanine966-N2)-methyltransferase [Motilibacter peucedani]|uniref:16S rRNA (Guanine966-N2)-methyltransferase n=1 Tax=Motilibacter peucedani TaxID=598650 RepID=A0A420XUP7_9ACTN|nr:16S rRNA (guanine(966)-N(2))-methyltransferase RsmD [Motilibacter peucedani]RKS80592.1 16S rRNA (guanine966-N2)-methyltransferase [Motilibacter peucedani]